MRSPPVPIPRMDPRSRPIDPFLQLQADDLLAAVVLVLPAIVLYSRHMHVAAAVAGAVGVAAAVPLVLWPPVDGRRGYARLAAWAMWLFDPRVFLVTQRPAGAARIYVSEVMADGSRGRRRLLPDTPARTRGRHAAGR